MGLLEMFDPEVVQAMKGFGPSDEEKQKAMNMGLLHAGLGILAGNRGYGKGQALSNAVGAGGIHGLNAYDRQINDTEKDQMRQLQTAQMAQGLVKQQRQNQHLSALAEKHPEIADLMKVNPELALKRLYPEDQYKTAGDTLLKVGPNGATPLYTAQKTPEWALRGPDGEMQVNPLYLDMKKQIAAAGRSTTPYYQFISTPQGIVAADARSGNVSLANVGGAPVVKASDDPALQGQIAESKEIGKTRGEKNTEAMLDAPRVIQNSETAIKYVDELLKHPGFNTAVGKSSMLGIQKIPGTDAKDFMTRLEQVRGGAFLEAFNSLKGGGQITEVEGKKATDAIARMDNASSEDEFRAAAEDYKAVIRAGMSRAKSKLGGNQEQTSFKMLPPAAQYAGKRMKAENGTIYRSDGTKWVKE